jgi:hypothetical protein
MPLVVTVLQSSMLRHMVGLIRFGQMSDAANTTLSKLGPF